MIIIDGLFGLLSSFSTCQSVSMLVWDGGYDRPMGLHGGYEEGMGQGTDHHTLTQTHPWVTHVPHYSMHKHGKFTDIYLPTGRLHAHNCKYFIHLWSSNQY